MPHPCNLVFQHCCRQHIARYPQLAADPRPQTPYKSCQCMLCLTLAISASSTVAEGLKARSLAVNSASVASCCRQQEGNVTAGQDQHACNTLPYQCCSRYSDHNVNLL